MAGPLDLGGFMGFMKATATRWRWPAMTIVDGNGDEVNMSGASVSGPTTSAASKNQTLVKNAAGSVDGIKAENVAAYDVYVLIFDKDTVPVVGTDTPLRALKFKAGQISAYALEAGTRCTTGIGYAIVKNDKSTAVAAGDLIDLEIDYH